MWLFCHKLNANGDLERHKARLVCNGKSQVEGVDCDETFSPVVKPATICTVLSLAMAYGVVIAKSDNSIFIFQHGNDISILAIIFTRTPSYLFLSQQKYAQEILEREVTPVDTQSKLSAETGPKFHDPTLYRSLAGALQYLAFTRPDIAYAVQQVCLFMQDPREAHFDALKRILRYIQGTIDHRLHLYPSSPTNLITYIDVDWGGCSDTHQSTSSYCCFLGDNIFCWSSKRQHTLSKSCTEAEYRGVANVIAETCWLRNLLLELQCPLRRLLLFIVIMSVQFIYLIIPYSTNAPSTLKWIFTLQENS
ncbi:uncharacterized protein LOC110735859 [Chenopodium quinoa]|uniref:uncharacterized protein LOC110735859 n=1 Tax=Chenopodium quinoa TaxID=63459 RepID=UPI000B799CC0|nr:uncharacterized protein LOC110735859 [Chenopodium quinoa]